MRRWVIAFVAFSFIAVTPLAGQPIKALSATVMSGGISGFEICPQFVCGSAIFMGRLHGEGGASGIWMISVNHYALDYDEGGSTEIFDGEWKLFSGWRLYRGHVPAGAITSGGDNTFRIDMDMVLQRGGSGNMTFDGHLNHNVFPPSIHGAILQ